MRGLILTFLVGALLNTALAIQCKLCWPPLNEDDCAENEANIDCRPWKDMGYDSCIEVNYHGNKSIARTCYPGYKCDGAKEWCRRYGPCTVKCCKYNLCNDGQDEELEEETGGAIANGVSLYLFLQSTMMALIFLRF
ncbi:uncharacterized protein LOC116287396 [Actinia tenebrosa]|uniref:Uncharacterized protein LOC116287396 n=1 Tax=Actinia tenebrosa TaxID=6105 RepID=A0A6P8H3A5_ACTTE|nr:uncharacterized protein LOC116287396 [Actinia tenebrosa]